MNNRRRVALVNQPDSPPKTRQFKGLPPELTEGIDHREVLPWPRILLVEEEQDGFSLYRFTEDGKCVGDTWHLTLEDAYDQAQFEYRNELGDWKQVPESIEDPLVFAIRSA